MTDAQFDGQMQIGPWTTVALSKARAQLGAIARHVSTTRNDIALTDNGQIIAALVNPDVLADLEEKAALADALIAKAEGREEEGIPHEEIVARSEADAA